MPAPYHISKVLADDRLHHGFFGREGGRSRGELASNNMSIGVGDNPDLVVSNRSSAAYAMGEHGIKDLVVLKQVHSTSVVTLSERPQGVIEADAMVTNRSDLLLGILTADCAPVLLGDPDAGIVGAAHAGWKGALGKDGRGVLETTLDAMEKLGALRDRIRAAIGPCISQGNYEVGWDFRDRFLELGLKHRRFFTPSDRESHYRFDLQGYVAHRLTSAGVGAVEPLAVCTYPAENGFFSFRRTTHAREPDYGRQISAIVLTE